MFRPWHHLTLAIKASCGVEIQAKDIIETRHLLDQMLASHTGQTVEKISADTQRDYYMTAAQSKVYGLVDEVLEKTAKDTKAKK